MLDRFEGKWEGELLTATLCLCEVCNKNIVSFETFQVISLPIETLVSFDGAVRNGDSDLNL